MLMYRVPLNYIDLVALSECYAPVTSFYETNCVFTAVTIYDWIFTLPNEIRIIWSQKMTGAKVLFVLNRYLWIALSVAVVMFDQWAGVSDAVSTTA